MSLGCTTETNVICKLNLNKKKSTHFWKEDSKSWVPCKDSSAVLRHTCDLGEVGWEQGLLLCFFFSQTLNNMYREVWGRARGTEGSSV